MELSTARRLAWAAEHGHAPLPSQVAQEVGAVLAAGAEVQVAPLEGLVINPNQSQPVA